MSAKKIVLTEPMETMKVIEYTNQHGLKKSAEKYGCDKSTLSRWIRTQGFEMVREYRKKQVQA